MGFFGFFSKEKKETLDKGLEKTKTGMFDKLARVVAGKSKVDDDVQRDKYLLEHYGIYTIRYENRHVFERPQQILDEILEVAGKRGWKVG